MADEKSSGLRERLIVAALTSLEGGEELALREVARAVGVSAMAPYRHFRDKSALLAAVAASGFDALQTDLLSADQRLDPGDALVAQGRAYIAFARAHPYLFRLMFAGHDGAPPPPENNAYGVMVRRVRELAPGDLEAATLACWSAVHGMATLALDGSLPATPSPQEQAALRLVIAGVAASGAANV